ncbi:MAG: TIGR02147 family protein [Bdellovibrionia bacterium]
MRSSETRPSARTLTKPSKEFVDLLEDEFARRSKRNPSYSLRAFAKSLGVHHYTLSRILKERRPLTLKMIQKLVSKLKMEPETVQQFLTQSRERKRKLPHFEPLELDKYQVIHDWYHTAIFELVTVKGFQPTPEWISERLNISQPIAASAIDRLFRVGLLTQDKNGKWIQTSANITTTQNDFTTQALRARQKQVLELGIRAVDEISYEMRVQGATTIAMNSKRLPEVRKRVHQFRKQLCSILQKDKERDVVYELVTSFYPMTAVKGSKK